jgi:vacuolar-type H+-ATPase subunit H
LIDQMRVAAPMELREAQELLAQKDDLLLKAREESQHLVAQAQEDVESRLTDNGLVKAAEEKAAEIIQEAERQAESMLRDTEERIQTRFGAAETVAAQQMEEADRYTLEMLRKLESQLSAFLGSVRAGVDSMGNKAQERVR